MKFDSIVSVILGGFFYFNIWPRNIYNIFNRPCLVPIPFFAFHTGFITKFSKFLNICCIRETTFSRFYFYRTRYSFLFRTDYKYILYVQTMYTCCDYTAQLFIQITVKFTPKKHTTFWLNLPWGVHNAVRARLVYSMPRCTKDVGTSILYELRLYLTPLYKQ